MNETDDLADLAADAHDAARALDDAIRAAASAGATQEEIARETGLSRSAVQRLLAGETRGVSVAGPVDEDGAEFRRQLRAERLKMARLRTAREATRLKREQDASQQLAEANSLTAVGPLDLGYDLASLDDD